MTFVSSFKFAAWLPVALFCFFVLSGSAQAAYYVPNVVALYHLENASDTTGSYDLTNNGSTAFVSGTLSKAADQGTSNTTKYLSTSTTMGIDGGAISMAAWINPNTVGSNQVFVWQGNANSDVYYYMYYSGTQLLCGRDKKNSEAREIGETIAMSAGTWYHVVCTYDGTNLRMYRDGDLKAGPTSQTGNGTSGAVNGFNIGSYENGGLKSSALIDEVVITNTAMSTTTINGLYNGGSGQEACLTVGCDGSAQTPTVDSLQQYEVDAVTPLAEGATTTERLVVFQGHLNSSSSNALKLQIELSTSTSFTNPRTATSGAVSVNSTTTAHIADIALGSFYWRARALDTITLATSSWMPFNATTTVDFFATSTGGYEISDESVQALYHLSDLLDTSGNGHRLTNNGSVTFTGSKAGFGNAADQGSNNTTKYLSAATTLGINGGAITLSAWVNPNTVGSNQVFVWQGNSSSQVYNYMYYSGSQLLCGRDKKNSEAREIGETIAMSAGTWYHVVCTYDGTNLRMYRDGDLKAGPTSQTGNGTSGAISGLNIGSYENGGLKSSALIDEVMVLDRALSATDISYLYNSGTGREACAVAGCGTAPTSFYAQIKNTDNGRWLLRNAMTSSTASSTYIKRLPEDWVVYVSSTVSSTGSPMVADGYRWYRVVDPTDGVEGWMAATSSGATYLSNSTSTTESQFKASSSDYVATSSRPSIILDAIDLFYNNASGTGSLSFYDNDVGENDIWKLKHRGYPQAILWGVAARESGVYSVEFDNENVSYDYGHGIMQLTFNAHYDTGPSPSSTWDNRGVGSYITIYPCPSIATTTYTKCYTGVPTSTDLKPYKNYDGIASNPKYKQYTNTRQSIYANVKDGMRVLEGKYEDPALLLTPITASTTASGTIYSAIEREIITATESYGPDCGYVDDVATELDRIHLHFPGTNSSTVSSTVQQMHQAGRDLVCAQLHSPGDLSIQDSTGRIVGVVNGTGRNDFDWAIYDKEQKWVKILFPEDDNYTFKVVGTGEGVYGLDITIKRGPQRIVFSTADIPIIPGQIIKYGVDKEAVLSGQGGVTVKIDNEGDGVIDSVTTQTATIRIDPPLQPPPAIHITPPPPPPPQPIFPPTPSSSLPAIDTTSSPIILLTPTSSLSRELHRQRVPWWERLAAMLLPQSIHKLITKL